MTHQYSPSPLTLNDLVFALRSCILDGDWDLVAKMKASKMAQLSVTPSGPIHLAAQEAFTCMESFSPEVDVIPYEFKTQKRAFTWVDNFIAKWEPVVGEKVTTTMAEVRQYILGEMPD